VVASTIVDIAVEDGRFGTLVTALNCSSSSRSSRHSCGRRSFHGLRPYG
jgi:hypothetical protein